MHEQQKAMQLKCYALRTAAQVTEGKRGDIVKGRLADTLLIYSYYCF